MTRSHSLIIDPAFEVTLRERGLDSLAALMNAESDANLAKPGLSGWRSRVMLHIDGDRLFLKRYDRPPLREQIAARVQGFAAVAAIEWHWLHRLRELGIATPRPVACGWQRRRGIERCSVLVTAAVPGRSLEQWARSTDETLDREWLHDRAYCAALSLALAALVRRLHEAGLFHRDLYLSHIFLDPNREPTEGLTLIDLQRVVHARLRHQRWTVKDLAALNYSVPTSFASRAQRLRWFKQYRRIDRLTHGDKTLLRRIAAKTRRIARHDRRRGRA